MPEAGGTYLYIDRAMGPLMGTIAGFGVWFSLVFKAAFALVGLSAYLEFFFHHPERLVAAAIAEVLSARYAVVPDMRWLDMSHFITADGSRACSEWTVKGTPKDAPPIDWLGCDVWTFRDGLVTKKDTYWKSIES